MGEYPARSHAGRSRGAASVLVSLLSLASCDRAPTELVVEHDERGRILIHPPLQPCDAGTGPKELRIASWNIAAGQRGTLEELATTLREVDADVVALQEVDVGTDRSNGVDQAQWLAMETDYEAVFGESLAIPGGSYGLAVLSRLPLSGVERRDLRDEFSSEPRILLDVSFCAGGREVRLINTHLDYVRDAAQDQLAGIAETLGAVFTGLLAADMNLAPGNASVMDFVEQTKLRDTFAGRDEGPTRDRRRIDYVFASRSIAGGVSAVSRVQSGASDHQLLVIDLDLPDD